MLTGAPANCWDMAIDSAGTTLYLICTPAAGLVLVKQDLTSAGSAFASIAVPGASNAAGGIASLVFDSRNSVTSGAAPVHVLYTMWRTATSDQSQFLTRLTVQPTTNQLVSATNVDQNPIPPSFSYTPALF